jgi:hypothetical protein
MPWWAWFLVSVGVLLVVYAALVLSLVLLG